MSDGRAWIGTSGYVYGHWRGRFYPTDVPQARWLEYYAQHYSTVELNVTFYRLPANAAFRGWRARTPDAFRFAVKGSRYITHIKRLLDPQDSVRVFMQRARLLREKLSVVLWQLPPTSHLDEPRLKRFLAVVRRYRVRHALEVRHASWLTRETFDALRAANVTLCMHDAKVCPVDDFQETADFVYVRRHSAVGEPEGRYPMKAIIADAAMIRQHLRAGRDAYVYYNNDGGGHAVDNAQQLIQQLEAR